MMLKHQHSSFCLTWQSLLVGLLFITMQCDARAVNVSNTWTMPQEGLNVFYRFFRDRISWFEADAVCQFHHANLVTVDNSFQFDATRDLLRELDVNDIVWIGLMRPQSSDRFMWSSNSRPLVADTGYWAESLPLMDAPLCAVIDPIRDYRWHALRCGGPETASFLCEMPVPSWADACNLKDMPNLTLQYMADTASIELIRNCQEEGLLRTMCRGKQDRERAMQDLICPRERLEAQRINDMTNSHFKSLQIINSIPSDNNENNDIELLPMEVNYGPHYPEELQTEKNTVQRLIEQFNVDELMQADEPSNMETVSSFYKIPGLIPKPVKKSGKKVLDYNKKTNTNTNTKEKPFLEGLENIKKPLNMEDMMMGDQPLRGEAEITEQLLNEEVSNEILEPLPHIKKTNIHKEDMEKMEKEAIALKKSMQKSKEMENKKMFAIMATTMQESKTTTSTTVTTTAKPLAVNKEETFVKEKQHDATTTTASVSIAHPMHPQQHEHEQQQQQERQSTLHTQHLLNEDQHQHQQQHQQQHNIETADNSHFIPPMLLVKSHYVPPASKHEHHTQSHHLDNTNQAKIEDFKETTTKTTTTTTTSTTTTTAAPISDLERTTLKSLDTFSLSSTKREEAEEEAKQMQTASDSTIKAITEQLTTETEQQQQDINFENLHFKNTPVATMAATTLHPVSFTNNDEDSRQSATVTFASATDETNKNEEETQELKPPQTTNRKAETTVTTKLLPITMVEKSREKLFELKTTEPAKTTVEQNQNEEREENGKPVENIIKTEAATQTTTELMPATTPPTTAKLTESLQNTAEPENNNNPALRREKETIQEEEEQLKPQQQDKKETIVKATETLGFTTTPITESETEPETINEAEENLKEQSTITTLIPRTAATTTTKATQTDNTAPITIPITTTTKAIATESISLTATTTVKPITITATTAGETVPQNEVKSTETSVSATSNTNNNNNNNENNNNPTNAQQSPPTPAIAGTTTITVMDTEASSSTTFKTSPSTTTRHKTANETDADTSKGTETETETFTTVLETAKAKEATPAKAIETATPPTSPETTTRNFLKSTTEMPFKPNRRRSLTKPETVSYMKKILG